MAAPNFKNRTLYHGDNLSFLRGMNSESVHLIATDPPFNKNRDFHATPDSLASGAKFEDRWRWEEETHDPWFDEIYQMHSEVWHAIMAAKQTYGSDMGAFLCFLGVRLLEMHRVLREDGSIYLHCDPTASHYIKGLLDAIFGAKNFINEIVWKRTTAHGDAKRLSRIHDIIFFYSKSKNFVWNKIYQPYEKSYIKKTFRHQDKNGRKYAADDLTGAALSGGGYTYEWNGHTRVWLCPIETMKRMGHENRLHYSGTGLVYRKRYLDEAKGKAPSDIWMDISPARKHERTGYPTQKPLALYERIIKASSSPDDIVLDPFCGCATTPIAAERLGRQWVGMDIWDSAYQVVLDRLADEGLASATGQAKDGQHILAFDKIHYQTDIPIRTDHDASSIPVFETPTRRAKKNYPKPRTQHDKLLTDLGAFCQGCGNNYGFDPRVLEVDHIRPKSDGGTDAYDNLTLLCPPCNRVKHDALTLSGLQIANRKNGYLKPENEKYLQRGRASKPKRRRRRR